MEVPGARVYVASSVHSIHVTINTVWEKGVWGPGCWCQWRSGAERLAKKGCGTNLAATRNWQRRPSWAHFTISGRTGSHSSAPPARRPIDIVGPPPLLTFGAPIG